MKQEQEPKKVEGDKAPPVSEAQCVIDLMVAIAARVQREGKGKAA